MGRVLRRRRHVARVRADAGVRAEGGGGVRDPFKSILTLGAAKQKAAVADMAAKEMARHCDKRIRRARAALRLIDTFAWSAVKADCPASHKELSRRIAKCREALSELGA